MAKDPFSVEVSTLVLALPWEYAEPFVEHLGFSCETWRKGQHSIAYATMRVREQCRVGALAAVGHSPMGANRAEQRLRAWLWLANLGSLADALNDCEGYPFHAPKFERVGAELNIALGTSAQWRNMREGQACGAHCAEGCWTPWANGKTLRWL